MTDETKTLPSQGALPEGSQFITLCNCPVGTCSMLDGWTPPKCRHDVERSVYGEPNPVHERSSSRPSPGYRGCDHPAGHCIEACDKWPNCYKIAGDGHSASVECICGSGFGMNLSCPVHGV